MCNSYEFDLILTNEETSTNICSIWLIHDDQSDLKVENGWKMVPKVES